MARRTFTEFDTELNIAMGKRDSFTAAIRNFVMDAAYYFVANAIRHPELESTDTQTLTSGDDNVALPADFWFPELVKNDTDGIPIRAGAIREFEANIKQPGNPGKYDRWGDSFYFDRKPTSNKSIKTWYTKRPAEPTGGQSSVLDELYDQLILLVSIKFAHEELRDYDQAAKMQLAITAYATQIKAPWRMTKTDDVDKHLRVRMRA